MSSLGSSGFFLLGRAGRLATAASCAAVSFSSDFDSLAAFLVLLRGVAGDAVAFDFAVFEAAGDFGVVLPVVLVVFGAFGDLGERGDFGAFDEAASDALEATEVDLARAGVDFREPAIVFSISERVKEKVIVRSWTSK